MLILKLVFCSFLVKAAGPADVAGCFSAWGAVGALSLAVQLAFCVFNFFHLFYF